MRYSLIIILTFLLVSVSSCHYFRERGLFLNREKALESIRSVPGSTHVKDTVKQTDVQVNQVAAVKDTVPVKAMPTPDPGKSFQQFRVIVGSFSNMKNAEELAEKYKKQGYSPEIIKVKNKPGSLLVSIFTFENREKANNQLQVIKVSVNKEAWIYSGKTD